MEEKQKFPSDLSLSEEFEVLLESGVALNNDQTIEFLNKILGSI
jgi:hypothetical protein